MTRGIFATGACVLASLIVACSGGDASSPAEARTNTGANAAANESAPSDTNTKSDPSAASVSGDGGADEATDAGSADSAASQGLGVACTKSEDCPSGFCTDGVCCNEACTTECRSCNQPGKMGTCSDVPLFGSDTYWFGDMQLECAHGVGFECNGKGACKLTGGIGCGSTDSSCVSDVCTNGECKWLAGEPCSSPTDCLSSGLTCSLGLCK